MNSFGPSASQQYRLIDVRPTKVWRQRFRREMLPALERANSLYCPSGRWPVRGWILLPRRDYNKINKYSTNLQLHIGEDNLILNNLSIVQAQCVTYGQASDPDAVYLIELTDPRGIVYNRWFQFPIMEQYNCRAPAYPQLFYRDSLNDNTPWTWETMLEHMWETMPPLGGWPGLPENPVGTPEGFWFQGVSAWPAFNDIIEHLGMTVTVDLNAGSPYDIEVNGGLAEEEDPYEDRLEDDLEWIDLGAGRVPRYIKVLFRKRYEIYGTEETVRRDQYQWATRPEPSAVIYIVSKEAPARFADATGTHYLWSDFTIRYDIDGNPLAVDVAAAEVIATERVTQYFRKIYDQTLGFMTRTYAGALPIFTNGQIDGVRWYIGEGGVEGGWRTQTVRGAFGPPWPDMWDWMA